MKRIHIQIFAAALASNFGAAQAQNITFPCKVTNACSFEGDSVDCSVQGGWTGDYNFVWDGSAFTVNAPRGSFKSVLQSEEQAWPIVLLSWADDGDPPAMFLLSDGNRMAGTIPLNDGGLIALQGTCEDPK